MKKKAKTQYSSMSQAELAQAIQKLETTLAEYRINRYSKQSKNVREGSLMKRTIAVMKTMIRQKEITHE